MLYITVAFKLAQRCEGQPIGATPHLAVQLIICHAMAETVGGSGASQVLSSQAPPSPPHLPACRVGGAALLRFLHNRSDLRLRLHGRSTKWWLCWGC